MKINLLAFGFAADTIGQRKLILELDNGTTTAMLKAQLELEYPPLTGLLSYSIAVNQSYIQEDVILNENDEVAIIPPVSGG
jgi:molybdopterin converting factor subunit 1